MSFLPSFLPILQPFEEVLTAPTFVSLCTLIRGWVFAARHNVTGSLRAAHEATVGKPARGRGRLSKHHSAYHRVFSAASWSLDQVGLLLMDMVLKLIEGTVFLAVDDTVCRKVGRKMFGVDSHYDAGATGRKLSKAGKSIKKRGHCWVTLGVVLRLPTGGWVCIPILFRLYMNNKAAGDNKITYRSRPDLARDLVRLACERHPRLHFHLLADSAYGGQDTVNQLPANCDFTARWQMNARIHQFLDPVAAKGRSGRPRKRGERLPSPGQMLDGKCDKITLDLYGRHQTLRVAAVHACLFTLPGKVLNLIAVEPQDRRGKPNKDHRAFYFSTALDASAEQVLSWYAKRWTIEVAFHDAKQQMGFEQPQGWSRPAVERTAPTLMLMYAMITLWFEQHGRKHHRQPHWPWYPHKRSISFADKLSALRLSMIKHELHESIKTHKKTGVEENPLRILVRLARMAA